MQSVPTQIVTEIPSSLKQLARLVVRGFYDIEYSLIVDMLVRYHCMREDDLCDILKFDKKLLRSKLATLKSDKFLMVKLKIETGEDGKSLKMNCWFINYRIFVNIVKYKLDHMRKKMETEERDATSRSSFKCSNCDKQFTDLEADQLFDPMSGEFRCTFCGSSVEEDEAAMPKKDSRLLLAKFNEQMEKLYDLLRNVEDVKLSPDLLDPHPVDFSVNESGVKKLLTESSAGAGVGGNWSGEMTRTGGGVKAEEQDVKITIGEEEKKQRQQKDVPIWVRESTVTGDPGGESAVPSGPSMGMLEDDLDNEGATNDEITDLLLRHERTNKDKVVIPGNDSDSEDKSDDSDVEISGDGVDRDADLLAATFATNAADDDDDEVEEMDDNSDENDDIPTINVGGEEYDITDVPSDVIANMSAEEMEKYNQLYQEFYKDMFD